MANAKKVKEAISSNDMYSLLDSLGGEPVTIGNTIESRTICHNGSHNGKRKLIYYSDSHSFHCYTECHSIDIFNIVMQVLGIDDFPEAVRYVMNYFGISNSDVEVVEGAEDYSFLNKFKKTQEVGKIEYEHLDMDVLDSYYPWFHESWKQEGISPALRNKYLTHYSIVENKIIIPHRDPDGNLIGVRGRALNENEIAQGRKYMPVTVKGKILRHLIGGNLYGIYENKDMIKKHKTVILFEAEKSVQMLNSFMPEFSVGLAVCGSSFTQEQAQLIFDLEVDNVVIAMDKEFIELGDKKDLFHRKKVRQVFGDKLTNRCNVSIMWDTENLLDFKDSPTDKGKEVFLKMYENRIFI